LSFFSQKFDQKSGAFSASVRFVSAEAPLLRPMPGFCPRSVLKKFNQNRGDILAAQEAPTINFSSEKP